MGQKLLRGGGWFWGQKGTSRAGGEGASVPNGALWWEGCLRGTGAIYKAPRDAKRGARRHRSWSPQQLTAVVEAGIMCNPIL